MDEFPAQDYGLVIAEAKQLTRELNEGNASLPGELNGEAVYSANLRNSLFLVLGIDRPLPTPSAASFGDELDGVQMAFESRFDGQTTEKLVEARGGWYISGPGLGNIPDTD
ncbi:MAG: hypothetical protein JWN26_528 [Candidatus Saccharibacteria bacterium]|nr:hypothetical protein [Candidatus Saccharibacteria bacterium]